MPWDKPDSEHTTCVLSDADSRLGMEVWNRKRGIDTASVERHERAGRREGKREYGRETDRQQAGSTTLEGELKGAERESKYKVPNTTNVHQ